MNNFQKFFFFNSAVLYANENDLKTLPFLPANGFGKNTSTND